MPSVFDVAAYILEHYGSMSAMKLQKLCYYSQAWSLVWDDNELFHEPIEAWVNGPVIPALYSAHRGVFKIDKGFFHGNASALSEPQRETVNAVCNVYGSLNAQQLSDLSHSEMPYIKARKGLQPTERGHNTISLADMAEFYSSIPE